MAAAYLSSGMACGPCGGTESLHLSFGAGILNRSFGRYARPPVRRRNIPGFLVFIPFRPPALRVLDSNEGVGSRNFPSKLRLCLCFPLFASALLRLRVSGVFVSDPTQSMISTQILLLCVNLDFILFLDASSHLYMRVCPSVRRSVRRYIRR